MKCAQCGYQNKDDVAACNLCGAVLKKQRRDTTMQTPPPPPPAPSRRHLLVRVGAPPIELAPGETFSVGRNTTCNLSIPSNRVSRVHAEIRWEGDQPVLSDKNSSNGTFVGGKRVKEHRLAPGDEIEIGPFLCVYQFGAPEERKLTDSEAFEGTQTLAGRGDIFTGMIADTGLAEVLQGLEFNAKTGTLDVYGREGEGWIAVEKGVPLAAEARELRDEEAVFFLLGLKSGRFAFAGTLDVKDRRIRGTITALLLEWGRRQDEANPGAARDTQLGL